MDNSAGEARWEIRPQFSINRIYGLPLYCYSPRLTPLFRNNGYSFSLSPNLNHSDNPYICFPIPDPLRIRSHPFEVFIFVLLCGFSIRVLSHSFVNLHLRLFVYIRRYFYSRAFASIRGLPTLNPQQYLIHRVQ